MTPTFYQHAQCRNTDSNLFVPPYRASQIVTAKKICNQCPVQTDCLNYALETQKTEQLLGIYGGLTETQREKILHQQTDRPRPRRTTRKPTHGTLYSYRVAKCRCDMCRAAHARTVSRQRKTRRNNSGTYLAENI